MRTGAMRKRMTFQRESETADGGGGYALSWTNVATVWGSFRPQLGKEVVQAGRLADPVMGVIEVRSSSTTRGITAEDRVMFDSTNYQIRSITNPDQRNHKLQMIVERAVAI